MTEELMNYLLLNETDVHGAIERLGGDEDVYLHILAQFPKDDTMAQLDTALSCQSWDAAFTAAHALKGLAGNLGFTPLFHSLGELVILIRAGRIKEIDAAFGSVKKLYDSIVEVINAYCK